MYGVVATQNGKEEIFTMLQLRETRKIKYLRCCSYGKWEKGKIYGVAAMRNGKEERFTAL